MVDALDGIDWKQIFSRNRGDAGGGRNKFTRLHQPLPMLLDADANTYRVLEWLCRFGRASYISQAEHSVLLPYGKQWFADNHRQGVMLHVCDQPKFFGYYEQYKYHFAEFMGVPRKQAMTTPHLQAARDMLWSMWNCVGKNEHYNPRKAQDFQMEVAAQPYRPFEAALISVNPGYKPPQGEEQFRCSRCPEKLPKRIRAIMFVQNLEGETSNDDF